MSYTIKMSELRPKWCWVSINNVMEHRFVSYDI